MSLPPIGAHVELAGPSPSLVPLHPEWAGKVVKIYAHFETDQGNKLAAYVSDDHQVGGVGIEELFVPFRAPEQIAAEEREMAIQSMCEHGIDAGDDTIYLTAKALYDAGYRKQTKG